PDAAPPTGLFRPLVQQWLTMWATCRRGQSRVCLKVRGCPSRNMLGTGHPAGWRVRECLSMDLCRSEWVLFAGEPGQRRGDVLDAGANVGGRGAGIVAIGVPGVRGGNGVAVVAFHP